MIVAGIDPGKKGVAIAVSTGKASGFYYKLRHDKSGHLDGRALYAFLSAAKPDMLIMEKPHALQRSGVSTAFGFGFSCGEVNALVGFWIGDDCSLHLVKPQDWQKLIHEGVDKKLEAKERSAIAYGRLFPHAPVPRGPKGGKPDDNVIDALLLATYGVLRFAKGELQRWGLTEWKG